MLRLAAVGRPAWAVSTVELDRGGQSYTVDTLRQLKAEHPADELFFLLGADALADLPRWREPQAICELATPVAVQRGGMPAPNFEALAPLVSPERLAAIRALHVEMPPATISSSEIQRLIAAGDAWQHLVPAAVANFIVDNRLYGAG
jgi:nicotinate-nucleotide adenylyltransferase